MPVVCLRIARLWQYHALELGTKALQRKAGDVSSKLAWRRSRRLAPAVGHLMCLGDVAKSRAMDRRRLTRGLQPLRR